MSDPYPGSAFQRVQGRCPKGCGETLFLGAEGYVTCSSLRCPEPDAASLWLENSDTIRRHIDETAEAWKKFVANYKAIGAPPPPRDPGKRGIG